MSQHLCLPSGVCDQAGDQVSTIDLVIDAHADVSRAFALGRIKTPYLGFASTFRIATSAAGERVLEFADRSGRPLMLAPDSTPSVLRHHCSVRKQARDAGRYAFESPVFRYRHGLRRRAFHHIGFAIVDGTSPIDADLVLVELATALCQMLLKLGEDISVRLSDVGLVRRLCSEAGIMEKDIGGFLHLMRHVDRSDRKAVIVSMLPDSVPRSRLIEVLASSGAEHDGGQVLNSLENTARLIKRHVQVPVTVDAGDLHGCETLDGIGMRVFAVDGVALGDGGAYGLLARRFDASLAACHSVATGLEFLADRLTSRTPPARRGDAVLLLALDATTAFVTTAAMALRAAGYGVACHAVKGSLRRALRRLPSNFAHLAVVGALEEDSGLVVLRPIDGGAGFTVRVPMPAAAASSHQPSLEPRSSCP